MNCLTLCKHGIPHCTAQCILMYVQVSLVTFPLLRSLRRISKSAGQPWCCRGQASIPLHSIVGEEQLLSGGDNASKLTAEQSLLDGKTSSTQQILL